MKNMLFISLLLCATASGSLAQCDSVEQVLEQGRIIMFTQPPDSLLGYYSRMVECDPTNTRYIAELAVAVSLISNNPKLGLEYINRAIKMDSTCAGCYSARISIVYHLLWQGVEDFRFFEKQQEEDMVRLYVLDSAAYYYQLVETSLRMSDSLRLAYMSRVIEIEPESWDAYLWRGQGYISIGDTASGCADFEKVILNRSDDIDYAADELYCRYCNGSLVDCEEVRKRKAARIEEYERRRKQNKH